ncbi:MAG: ABC transporter permease [Clostridia bacterium]|nr:ABC transporter permease [Clostridia bacterium]
MFIFKYALKSISRSIGRNILIGIIVLIIATAACIAMSIRQAAQTAASNSLKGMNISAQVNIDRGYIYQKAKENKGTEEMSALMPEMMSLMKENAIDLEDMESYAAIKKADSDEALVKDYYYNASLSINGDSIKKYDLTASDDDSSSDSKQKTTEESKTNTVVDPQGNVVETPTPPAPEQQEPQQMEKAGDFSLVGYSAYKAMEDFADEENGCSVTKGEMFKDNTSDYVCLIEDNLATFNDVGVGDSITLVNPNNEEETYKLEVVGIYKNSSGSTSEGSDAANTIITSYAVVKDIESQSEKTNADSSSDDEDSKVLVSQFDGTFVFGSVDDYNQFKEEVKNKAVSDGYDGDMYIVTSGDVATFKAGLKPLENLKSFAMTFLYLTLAIGAIVLVVISVISIRDRKYEIGVLAAMGIKKFKLSMMFMLEILMVTLVAIMAGIIIGSAASVPVTNNLLSAQVEQQEEKTDSQQQQQQQPGMPAGNMERPEDGEVTGQVTYVEEVQFSVNIFVVLEMLAIGIGLSVVSGFTSILFILRYDPKQILANRD